MSDAAATQSRRRATAVGRRIGFGIAILVNLVFLWLTLVWPGWEAVPFLTSEAAAVVPLFVAALVVGVVVNIVNVIADSRALRAVGDIASTAMGFWVLLRLWEVFPFDFVDAGFGGGIDWAAGTRTVLVIAMVGCAIGVMVQLAVLGRIAAGADRV